MWIKMLSLFNVEGWWWKKHCEHFNFLYPEGFKRDPDPWMPLWKTDTVPRNIKNCFCVGKCYTASVTLIKPLMYRWLLHLNHRLCDNFTITNKLIYPEGRSHCCSAQVMKEHTAKQLPVSPEVQCGWRFLSPGCDRWQGSRELEEWAASTNAIQWPSSPVTTEGPGGSCSTAGRYHYCFCIKRGIIRLENIIEG